MRMSLGFGLAAVLVLAACSGEKADENLPAARPDGKVVVLSVNYPLAYFAQRIGGESVDAQYPGPAGEDPAFWNPPPEAVLRYHAADLIVLNGAGYAHWLEKVTLPASKLVDTSAGFADRFITLEDAVTHAHGPGGEHAHAGLAFTTWLDFTQAAMQAEAIAGAMTARSPALAETFAANLSALQGDLLALDAELAAAVAGKHDLPLLASHPVYQYLARRYDLKLAAVHWEPGTVPDARQWEELGRLLETHPARWMIWEGEPAPDSVRRLEELGLGSVVFDPCATPPANGDFLTVMRRNVAELVRALE